MKLITIAFIVLLSGCASDQPRTAEQVTASIENKKAILAGALTPGTDKRCLSFLSIELCYTRERTQD